MTYRFVSAARRDLRKLPAADARVIVDAIEALADRGTGDVKKLKDYKPPAWRYASAASGCSSSGRLQ